MAIAIEGIGIWTKDQEVKSYQVRVLQILTGPWILLVKKPMIQESTIQAKIWNAKKQEPKNSLKNLQDHPDSYSNVQSWQPFLEKLAKQASNADNIQYKNERVDEYKSTVDYIEQHIHLGQQEMRADQLLKDGSNLPNMLDYVKESEKLLKNIAARALQDYNTPYINKCVEEYKSHVDHIEQDIHLEQQKARFYTLLQDSSHFQNSSRERKKLIRQPK